MDVRSATFEMAKTQAVALIAEIDLQASLPIEKQSCNRIEIIVDSLKYALEQLRSPLAIEYLGKHEIKGRGTVYIVNRLRYPHIKFGNMVKVDGKIYTVLAVESTEKNGNVTTEVGLLLSLIS